MWLLILYSLTWAILQNGVSTFEECINNIDFALTTLIDISGTNYRVHEEAAAPAWASCLLSHLVSFAGLREPKAKLIRVVVHTAASGEVLTKPSALVSTLPSQWYGGGCDSEPFVVSVCGLVCCSFCWKRCWTGWVNLMSKSSVVYLYASHL